METRSVKLLFDENFSHKHIAFVQKESRLCEMQHMRKIGWAGKKDKDWIPDAVSSDFVIITGDRNEKTREYTVRDLKTLNARVILLGRFWDHMGVWEKAKWLVARINRIVDIAQTLNPGNVILLGKFLKRTDL